MEALKIAPQISVEQLVQPGILDEQAMASAAPHHLNDPAPTAVIATPSPPFPLQPQVWQAYSAVSVCAFRNYTRVLLDLLMHQPTSLANRRFELEAFIVLLHYSHKWWGYARQVMGSIFTTRNPHHIRDEERSDYAVRLWLGCRDLIAPEDYMMAPEQERKANEWMRQSVYRMMIRYLSDRDGKWKEDVSKEDLDMCEEWAQSIHNSRYYEPEIAPGDEPEVVPSDEPEVVPVITVPKQESLESPSQITQIQRDLRARLAPTARVNFRGSVGYQNATTRWSAGHHPDFAAVVMPTSTEDVAASIKLANMLGVPFLAVNRGHGTAMDINDCRHGINIHIRTLDSITFAEDGQSAVLGGGVYGDQVVRSLAARGKATATGACTCVGLLGPGLGGGLGRYQGFYGLVADNILEMTVVTAKGSIVTASDRQNAELFWAMRGAGHNFGIVTQIKYKIYDDVVPDWWIATYHFTKEYIDQVFEVLNQLNGNGSQPKELTTYTVLVFDREVSHEPFIVVTIYFAGSATIGQIYAQPLLNLNPFCITNRTVPYPDLADAVGTGTSSPLCQQPGNSAAVYPVGLLIFNTTAIHQVYDIYSDLVTNYPDFSHSIVQLEAYPVEKIQSVNPETTAYAHREDNLLVSLLSIYTPSTTNDIIALKYGRQIRDAFHAGQPGRQLNAYVNYASGDETMEQMYGHEEWRLEKLRRLKEEWDPQGRFGFYHPIR
ncbi:MAG: hypothetical protein Q9177_001516 [Variospora cf. flavescens]